MQEKRKKLFLRHSNGNFAELLEILHQIQSSLAGASTSSLVAFDDLSFSVSLEELDVLFDFLNKIFHDDGFNGVIIIVNMVTA